MSENRFENIEAQLAHLEAGSQELSDVLYRQQRHIERLERAVEALGQKLKDAGVADDAARPLEDDKPPHY